MLHLRGLLSRFRPALTPLELRLLAEVQRQLGGQAAELLQRQVRAVNLVQRHSDGREVCCYTVVNGKVYRDPAIDFPNRTLEATLARIHFSHREHRGNWKVDTITVSGHLSAMVFDRSPKPLHGRDDIHIQGINILIDPMAPVARVAPSEARPAAPGQIRWQGWLQEWDERYGLQQPSLPLSADDREKLLRTLPVHLPQDYLELIRQCEGFTLRDCGVLGLSETYVISLEDGDHYLLADCGGRGAVTVRAEADDQLQYHSYSGDPPIRLGSSFRAAIERVLEIDE